MPRFATRFAPLFLSCAVAVSSTAPAQETPTQRAAAVDVVRRQGELQQRINASALAARLAGAPNARRDAVVARAKALWDGELQAMADDITRNPEVGFKETRSVKILTDWLTAHGFAVQINVAGLSTAFIARYTKGTPGPTLGIIVEYDALRGTTRDYHGDQHSAQGPVGLAAAVAVAEFLTSSKTPGTVTVYGTPAEEMMPPPSKTVMHQAGVFNGADVIVRSHSSVNTQRPAPGFGTCCLNIDGVRYTFSGAPAHQMTAWEGRDALTAVIHLFQNVDALRKNMRPETRIQGIIPEGGKAPNVVPDRAVADFYIRYPDEVYLAQVREMIDNAARGAALATGTKVAIDNYGSMRDGISTAALNEVAFAYLKKYGATRVVAEPQKPQGYEETGSVSRDIPGAGFSAFTSTGGFHTYEMEADALNEVGHTGFRIDAMAMAALLTDFATDANFRARVKDEFSTTKALFGDYVNALRKAYPLPEVK
ncbi:MAG TPA: peptidase dimerization domain-containing protein [Gemmatimonadaceae bacterium]|nr:peptidase dimerization domain-containing protein [Gemmatimonadaceae bacterium]